MNESKTQKLYVDLFLREQTKKKQRKIGVDTQCENDFFTCIKGMLKSTDPRITEHIKCTGLIRCQNIGTYVNMN